MSISLTPKQMLHIRVPEDTLHQLRLRSAQSGVAVSSLVNLYLNQALSNPAI